MQVVINISDELYQNMKQLPYSTVLESIILNGAVLPENHGRLIDADAFVKYCTDGLSFFLPMFTTKEYRNLAIDVTKSIVKDIKEAPTIVNATEIVQDAYDSERELEYAHAEADHHGEFTCLIVAVRLLFVEECAHPVRV